MDQQKPTITDIRIRNTNDAHVLFYAVSERLLPIIRRRLDPEERAQVRPGSCYIWEERSADEEAVGMGMERWTDGQSWGPSRTRDDFLFYIQKSTDDPDASSKGRMKYGKRRRSQPVPRHSESAADVSSSPIVVPSTPVTPPAGSLDDHKLVKQTYSVYTKLPDSKPVRKWHLTAYYTPHAVASGQLKDITQIPLLANLQVPPNRFKAARVGKRGNTGSSTTTSATELPISAVTPASSWNHNTAIADYYGGVDGGGGAQTMEPSRYPPQYRPAGAPSSSGGSSGGSPLQVGSRRGDVSPTVGMSSSSRHGAHLSWPNMSASGSSPVSRHQPTYSPYMGSAGSATYSFHQQPLPRTYSPMPQVYAPPPPSQVPVSTSPRPRNLSLPTVGQGYATYHHYPQAPPQPHPRYATSPSYDHQIPAYPPTYAAPSSSRPPLAHKPHDDAPISPAGSDDEGDHDGDVRMHDSPVSGGGLTTLVENRALPPLDFSTLTSLPARTAEDERTLWALTKEFNR